MTTIIASRMNTRVFVAFEGQSKLLDALLFETAKLFAGVPGRAEFTFEGEPQSLFEFDFLRRYDAIQFEKTFNQTEWDASSAHAFGGSLYDQMVKAGLYRVDIEHALYEATFPALERLEA